MRQWINLAEALRPTHAMAPTKIEGTFSYIILPDPDDYPDDDWIENSDMVVFDLAPWFHEAPSNILMLLFKDEFGCEQDIVEHYSEAANEEIKFLIANSNAWVASFDIDEAQTWVRAKRPEIIEEYEAFAKHEGEIFEALKPTHAIAPTKIIAWVDYWDDDECNINERGEYEFDCLPWFKQASDVEIKNYFKWEDGGASFDIAEAMVKFCAEHDTTLANIIETSEKWNVGAYDNKEIVAWLKAMKPALYAQIQKEKLEEALRPVGIAPPEVDAYLTYISNDVDVEDGADLTWSEHGNNYHFDATPWLRLATFEDINACVLHMYSLTKTTMSAVNGHKLDYLYTDGEEIAQFCADYDADLKTLLENAHAYQAQIDAVAAVMWLRAYRPEILEQANLLKEALKPHHSKPILEWRPTIEGNYQLEEVNPEDHHAGLYEEWGFIYDLGGTDDLLYFEWAALERGTGALLANGNTDSLNEAMRAVEAVHGLPECHAV